MGRPDVPLRRCLADRIVDLFVGQVYETRRKDVVRLTISEGSPLSQKLAEFYYREVLSRIAAASAGAAAALRPRAASAGRPRRTFRRSALPRRGSLSPSSGTACSDRFESRLDVRKTIEDASRPACSRRGECHERRDSASPGSCFPRALALAGCDTQRPRPRPAVELIESRADFCLRLDLSRDVSPETLQSSARAITSREGDPAVYGRRRPAKSGRYRAEIRPSSTRSRPSIVPRNC